MYPSGATGSTELNLYFFAQKYFFSILKGKYFLLPIYMKAIILASGEGSRLRPLTDTTPKPLIKILGKTLIEHTLESLDWLVDECIIVIKYKPEQFKKTLGKTYKTISLSYHLQGEKNGTAAAIKDISLTNNEDILVLYGDTIYPKEEIQKVLYDTEYWCLVKQVENPEIYGVFIEKNGYAQKVVEKPNEYIWNLANMAGYKFSSEIIEMCKNTKISERWEYEITDALNSFIAKYPFKLHHIEHDLIDIWYAWNLLDANTFFLEKLEKSHISGTIEDNVTIHGNIILEEWAIIKSGSYIEGNCYFGKNSTIWPNAYIRGNTSLWEQGKIGFSVEVKNSHIWENSKIPHLSYLWDSVLWNNVNLWAGFKVANLRHDGKNISAMVKWDLIDTGKRKFWCIIWDGVHTGINTSVYPGRTLETSSMTPPWEIIK